MCPKAQIKVLVEIVTDVKRPIFIGHSVIDLERIKATDRSRRHEETIGTQAQISRKRSSVAHAGEASQDHRTGPSDLCGPARAGQKSPHYFFSCDSSCLSVRNSHTKLTAADSCQAMPAFSHSSSLTYSLVTISVSSCTDVIGGPSPGGPELNCRISTQTTVTALPGSEDTQDTAGRYALSGITRACNQQSQQRRDSIALAYPCVVVNIAPCHIPWALAYSCASAISIMRLAAAIPLCDRPTKHREPDSRLSREPARSGHRVGQQKDPQSGRGSLALIAPYS